jgi:hypothetical protein
VFGWFKRGRPTADEVLTHAERSVRAHLPPSAQVARDGTSLTLSLDGVRGTRWNLAEVVRLAPEDPDWRTGVEALARQAAQGLSTPREGSAQPRPRHLLQVRLLPASAVPGWSGDLVFPGVVAVFGWPDGAGRFTSASPEERPGLDEDGLALRRVAAMNALRTHPFHPQDLLHPLHPSLPVFTNAPHPCIAVTLMLPWLWTQEVVPLLPGKSGVLLAAVPSADRVLLAAGDSIELQRTLRTLATAGAGMEDQAFPAQLYRFHRDEWTVLGTEAN